MKRRATIIAISIKFDNFSRVITAKKPVKKCDERSEFFFTYFLVSVRVVVVALSSLVLVALPRKTILHIVTILPENPTV